MNRTILIGTLLLSALATPALAQNVVQQVTVVQPPTEIVREVIIKAPDLNHYVGSTLFGWGEANLGVVSSANPITGVIGVTGRHGEFAMISSDMLTHDGWRLHAPTLTAGDIKVASEAQFANPAAILLAPHVIVVEPPQG